LFSEKVPTWWDGKLRAQEVLEWGVSALGTTDSFSVIFSTALLFPSSLL